MASSAFGAEPLGLCRRWSVKDKKYIEINRLAVIKHYNESMGGVSLLDRIVSKYPMSSKTDKWIIRCIYALIDFCAAVSWLQYKKDCLAAETSKKHIQDYLSFKFSLARSLLYSKNRSEPTSDEIDEEHENVTKKRRRTAPIPDKRLRSKEAKHLPEFVNESQKSRSKCRYPGCHNLMFVKCARCKVFLCCSVNRNCLTKFHQ
ncbi:uncharacterized protein [Diabrotica undecimpunctata]|uniref:uncharacterized protein n=1 Tax=Diabrotica undecimpunctata TaxID=50387 RepID=UPI003B636E4B